MRRATTMTTALVPGSTRSASATVATIGTVVVGAHVVKRSSTASWSPGRTRPSTQSPPTRADTGIRPASDESSSEATTSTPVSNSSPS